MALVKKHELYNGVVTTYHRILSFETDLKENKINVTILSYVSEKQRTLELGDAAIVDDLKKLRDELNTLMQDVKKENESRRIELSEAINAIAESGEPEVVERHVAEVKTEIKITRGEDDYTRARIYELLSSEGGLFEGAKKS